MRPSRLALLLPLLLAGACGSPTAPSPPDAPPAGAAAGRQAYGAQGCARCHGDNGEGGRGAKLVPVGRPETAWVLAFRAEHSRDYPVSRLSDDQLLGVYAWLQTLR